MPRHKMAPGTWGDIGYRRLSDGTLEGRVYYRTAAGVRRDTTARGKTKAAIERALKSRLPELVAAAPEDATANLTVADVARAWIDWEQQKVNEVPRQKAPTTHAEHCRIIRATLLPQFGDVRAGDLRSGEVHNWYTNAHRKTPALARHAKSVLSAIMDYGGVMGAYDGENPCAKVKSMRRGKREVFAPNISELRVFRDAVEAYMNDPDRPGPAPSDLLIDVIDLILATGLRIGEVLGLRYGDDIILDAEQPYVVVHGAVKEKGGAKRWEPFPKTEASRRAIALPPFAVAVIRRRAAANRTGSPYLFHTWPSRPDKVQRPNGQQDVHRALRNVRAHAGLPDDYIPHALRKNVATQIAAADGLSAAASYMGHSDLRITDQFYFRREMQTADSSALLQAQYEVMTSRSGTN
ncbi:tyrosine-type recombinase/integrase [Microbacterium sp. No. 7]|uniref:tyrosine-type recombinase/integrase n=1 Tax=Microbacterium sp. No. 7 TaxID=1714373 RepID=UPI003007F27D